MFINVLLIISANDSYNSGPYHTTFKVNDTIAKVSIEIFDNCEDEGDKTFYVIVLFIDEFKDSYNVIFNTSATLKTEVMIKDDDCK